jgi:hypothetical protein
MPLAISYYWGVCEQAMNNNIQRSLLIDVINPIFLLLSYTKSRMKKNNTANKRKSAAKHIQNDKRVDKPTNNMRGNINDNDDKKIKEKQIIIERSSGRHEKFDSNRMAQTVSRSGVPFMMAKDVAQNVSNKIKKEPSSRQGSGIKNTDKEHSTGNDLGNTVNHVDNESEQQRQEGTEDKTVTASQIRGLVASELRDRNRGDIAASYSGETPENTLGDQFNKQNENDRISVTGATQHTRQPANRNRVIHDTSKRGGGIST